MTRFEDSGIRTVCPCGHVTVGDGCEVCGIQYTYPLGRDNALACMDNGRQIAMVPNPRLQQMVRS